MSNITYYLLFTQKLYKNRVITDNHEKGWTRKYKKITTDLKCL